MEKRIQGLPSTIADFDSLMIRIITFTRKCYMNLDFEADPSLGEVDLLILNDGGLAPALQLRIERQHHVGYYQTTPMCDTTIL